MTGGKGSRCVPSLLTRSVFTQPMNRFILANTEQLHDKIKVMSERIRKLEEALKTDHSQLTGSEHPLLRQDLLSIKKSPELFGIDQHLQQPPSESTPEAQPRHEDQMVEEHHRAGSATSSREGDEVASWPSPKRGSSANVPDQHYNFSIPGSLGGEPYRQTTSSDDLARLSRAFPSPWSISYELDLSMRQRIRDMLPSRAEAQHLCEQARRNAFWQ